MMIWFKSAFVLTLAALFLAACKSREFNTEANLHTTIPNGVPSQREAVQKRGLSCATSLGDVNLKMSISPFQNGSADIEYMKSGLVSEQKSYKKACAIKQSQEESKNDVLRCTFTLGGFFEIDLKEMRYRYDADFDQSPSYVGEGKLQRDTQVFSRTRVFCTISLDKPN